MGRILVGTCSWSSPDLRGRFYPESIQPREMISYYAKHFRLVEVDVTFYRVPPVKTFDGWVARTPSDFVFDVKAYRQLTRHDRDVEPGKDVFGAFVGALKPLYEANKLGLVLFQFPPWFRLSEENMAYILRCKELMQPYRIAIEFRHSSWLRPDVRERTKQFLQQNDLPYVCVDEPQFPGSTVPPIAFVTSDVALVRFHGRNKDAWFRRDVSVAERFNYLYSAEELAEWVPKIKQLSESTADVHVLMNNCYHDFAVRNARDIGKLLGLGDTSMRAGSYLQRDRAQPRLL